MVSSNGCVEWFQKRTNLEKTLLSLSSLLLLTLLLVVIVGVASRGKNTANGSGDGEGCWSRECLQTAGSILSSIDHEVDLCADFYGFACGKFGSKPGHSTSAAKESTESVYLALKRLLEGRGKNLDDLKSFYNSCVEFGSHREDALSTASSFLDLMSELGVGAWPILDPLYDYSSFSLDHTLVSLTLLDVAVVFKMEVVPDQKIAGSYLIRISPGGPRESGRQPIEIRSDVHLRSSVLTSLMLLGATSASTANDVQDILYVDSTFAVIEQDNSTKCDEVMLTPQESISELNRLLPELNWAYIVGELRRATGLTRPFAVELHCHQKIRDYVVHLNDLTIRSELNYLGWRFFSQFLEFVIPTFQKSQFGSSEQSKSRWKICLELMENFASPLLAKALTVDKTTEEQVEKISKSTLTTASKMVSETKWMTDVQKSEIQEKLSRIQILYPFSEGGTSESIDIPQVSLANFTSAVVHLQRRNIIQRFKKLMNNEGTEETNSWTPLLFSDDESSFSDYTVPIYFDKIQPPFLRPHHNDWMNYGGFGVFVARKITEILLKQTEGTYVSLWSLWSNNNLHTITCFMKSYINQLGMKSDDIQKISQTVIDDVMRQMFLERSSLEIAFQAAKSFAMSSRRLPGLEWAEEMFFIAHAQGFCDASPVRNSSTRTKERFNSMLSSFGAFSEAFSCSGTSSKCQIWV